MTRIIELAHTSPSGRGRTREARACQGEASIEGATGGGFAPFSLLHAIVLESVGPIRHEVSVPFHDSQVRRAALLIQTGWDEFWGTEAYWSPGPFLGEHLIFRCVRAGVRVVGVDFPIADRTNETRLISTGNISIIENLRGLASLPRVGFRFSAIALEQSSEPVPVRAFAEIG